MIRARQPEAAEDAVRPVQLPPAPPGLIGREAELARLDELWRAEHDTPSIAVVTGVGGIGKTALAVQWLHRRRDEFPDGILFASLAPEDDETAAPASGALHGFLAALGVPADEIPASFAQRAAAFRAATADRAFGVLLDDAAHGAEVRAMLPASSSSIVLVTSRSRLTSLTLDGAEIIPLDPLPVPEAKEVLTHRAGRGQLDDEAAGELITACAGLPLALAITGARLRTHPARSTRREARRSPLAADRLATVFDASYTALSTSAAALYRLCGLLPGPHHALDSLPGALLSTPDQLYDDVDELIEANLLTEVDDETVAQHDVVRQDARTRAERERTPEDNADALLRVTRWYRDRMFAANALIHPFQPVFTRTTAAAGSAFPDRAQALRWWRRNLPVIRAVAAEAARRGWDTETWQFGELFWGFYLHHRDPAPLIALSSAGAEAAHRCGAPLAEARLRSQLGFVYDKLGRGEDAAAQHAVALEIGDREGHGPTQATALSRLARAARSRGELETALELYRQSAAAHARIDQPRGVGLALRRCGEVLLLLGRDDEALGDLSEAAAIMAQAGDTSQHARAVISLARVHDRRGDHELACRELRSVLEQVDRRQSPHYRAEILTALADLEAGHGAGEAASQYREEARRLRREAGEPPD